jgi:glycogen operon protein
MDESVLVVVQGTPEPRDVILPGPPWASGYRLLWDSAEPTPPSPQAARALQAPSAIAVPAMCLQVYAANS